MEGKSIRALQCLIISPSDVPDARASVRRGIDKFNQTVGQLLDVTVIPLAWETETHPSTGDSPQSIINRQLTDKADFGIAIFATKIGTETENATSGSVEEIERLIAKGSNVIIYFSKEKVDPGTIDPKQLDSLNQFKSKVQKLALTGSFEDSKSLEDQVAKHLTRLIGANPEPRSSTQQDNSPYKPDIRVNAKYSEVHQPTARRNTPPRRFLSVSIENHSRDTLFMQGIYLEMTEPNKIAYPPFNALTGEAQSSREIAPGDSIDFFIDIKNGFDQDTDPINDIKTVFVRDKIGRDYYCDPDQYASEAKRVLNP